MNLSTTPVMEVVLRFDTGAAEESERTYRVFVQKLHEEGLSCVHLVTGPATPDGEQLVRMYVVIPRGQKALEKTPEVAALQSRLHGIFLAASRPAPDEPGTVH